MHLLLLYIPLLFPLVGFLFLTVSFSEYEYLIGLPFSYIPVFMYGYFLLGTMLAFYFKPSISIKKVSSYDYNGVNAVNLILIYILSIFVFLFIVKNYNFLGLLLGEISKEDIRRSGFLNAFLIKYLMPAIFSYFCILKRVGVNIKNSWLLILGIVTFLVGMSAGGKASGIMALLPGVLIILHGKFGLKQFFFLSIAAFSFLVLSAFIFDDFLQGDLGKIFSYIVLRAFVYTAEVPYKISYLYFNGELDFKYMYTLAEVLSKSILVNFVPAGELHNYIYSQAVTSLLYPEMLDKISSGAWNLTPNVYVESLLLAGVAFLPIFGFAVVYIGFLIYKMAIIFINKKQYALASVSVVYFVFVYVSWLNSSGFTHLVHPLAIISLFTTFFIIHFLSKIKIFQARI